MSIKDSHVFLTKHGWRFLDSDSPKNGELGQSTYTYRSKGYDSPDTESVITLLYAPFQQKRLAIKVTKRNKYLEYIREVGKITKKPIKKVENGMIKLICQGKSNTFQFSLEDEVVPGNYPLAGLLIVENSDYKIHYGY